MPQKNSPKINVNMKYFDELKNAMKMLSDHPDTIFIGQSVVYPGTGLYDSFVDVPSSKKYEMPVAENLQMGISIGLSLTGKIPISVYPRWNFLLSATDQIVNHLDKIPLMSNYELMPKVIIRVAVGSINPIDPQDQHKGDFTDAFQSMCKSINIIRLTTPEIIIESYKYALEGTHFSSILVEYPDYGK
jgi:pyruvate/2-oxoglutarate/acetoin dehydrogenase E1 component